MTDLTVSAYYSHPGTLICERCRAVWRITGALFEEPGDVEVILERYDTHVCDPDVDAGDVEAVRAFGRLLAVDLPPRPALSWAVADITGADDPRIAEAEWWRQQTHTAGRRIIDRFGAQRALMTAATPWVQSADRELWEDVLFAARCAADHAHRTPPWGS